MPREVYINFVLYMDDESEINEEAMDGLLENFLTATGDSGLCISGGVVSADELDDAEISAEDDVCDKCGGLGYLDPEDTVETLSEEDWDDLYGEEKTKTPEESKPESDE